MRIIFNIILKIIYFEDDIAIYIEYIKIVQIEDYIEDIIEVYLGDNVDV